MMNGSKNAVVIGGGVAGIQAALDLANMGIHVELIEKQSCIGGRMAQLDKTFPTLDCSICILAPKLSECYRHQNIKVNTLSEVVKIEGEPGNFKVDVLKKARYVKEDECINCGLCAEKCPTRVDDEFDRNLRKRKAIYMYYLQGVPAVMAIDPERCLYLTKGACRLCEKNCDRNAIDFDQKDEIVTIDDVGAIVVATGYDLFEDNYKLPRHGLGTYRNVVTGLEFERLLSASGPQGGHVRRLSDGKEPKKIAFLQCVGSRNVRNKDYCSAICCMYTTKQAMVVNEHDETIRSTVFYIDLRAGGKGFQKFLNRGGEDYDIRYIKSKIGEITVDENENPIITYENLENGEVKQEVFDMAVLSTCIVNSHGNLDLSKVLGLELNEYNFIKTRPFDALSTTREGIFTCGCAHEPMDIPRSVAEASGAAAKAAEVIKGES
ncbi:MAG: FAD-dependent oxidoreductase [Promethearchaeota archaeon]